MNDQLREEEMAPIDDTRWEAIQHVLKYQEDINKRYDNQVKL